MSQQEIILGGGCFWCVEAAFERVPGVLQTECGYAGGTIMNPSYETVCSGETGHAEVVRIVFDAETLSLERVLDLFFLIHDPTSLNRQGADVGTQYRSAIYTTSNEQLARVSEYIQRIKEKGAYILPIVTEVKPLEIFYPAEAYHQHYFQHHPENAYCQVVIRPKIDKIEKEMSA